MGGRPLTVRFLDAGQALSALVTLPDGRNVLVDGGESPRRVGCTACKDWHARVLEGLRRGLEGRPLDVLWVTHQHSDHLGGIPDILGTVPAKVYVHNGLDLQKPVVKDAYEAAAKAHARIVVVDPEHVEAPLPSSDELKLTPILPRTWSEHTCASDPNACSIALRIDYCKSSLLFMGDAPSGEEGAMDFRGPATLLQVGHHGSETSTGAALLAAVKPQYAVISAGKQNEGTNKGYCHPRALTVEHLTDAMGGPRGATIHAFDGAVKCDAQHPAPAHWSDVPASDHIWVTARDGEIVLETKGDGVFTRKP